MSETKPTILWLRRDLRLSDNPGACRSLREGRAGDPGLYPR